MAEFILLRAVHMFDPEWDPRDAEAHYLQVGPVLSPSAKPYIFQDLTDSEKLHSTTTTDAKEFILREVAMWLPEDGEELKKEYLKSFSYGFNDLELYQQKQSPLYANIPIATYRYCDYDDDNDDIVTITYSLLKIKD